MTTTRRTNHVHTFQVYPADTRYGYCSCGATARMQTDAAGIAAPVRSANPLLACYGPGPSGEHCKTCQHLYRDRHHDQTYLKCDLRTLTRGAGSDHRAKWDACGRYLSGRIR